VQTNLTGTTNSTAVTNYSWYQVETPPKVSITNTNNGATSSATVKSTGHSAPGPRHKGEAAGHDMRQNGRNNQANVRCST
jgi:hypothetical protein